MFDEEPLKKETAHVVGQDLSTFSIEELEKRIADLNLEIDRLEAEAESKRASKKSAESFFKS